MASATTAIAVSATASGQMLHQVVYLLLRSLTVFLYLSLEIERLSGKGMVQVYLHLFFAYLNHPTVKAVSFLILQGDDGIYIDILVVKVTVDAEYVA